MYVKTYYYFGEVNLDKYYKNMLFGIAIFVGGMITFLIISKILKPSSEESFNQISFKNNKNI